MSNHKFNEARVIIRTFTCVQSLFFVSVVNLLSCSKSTLEFAYPAFV